MTSSSARRTSATGLTALLLVLAGVMVTLQAARERLVGRDAMPSRVMYVTSPAVLTRAALSFDAVVADVYWIRAIQYYGSTRLSPATDKSYEWLYPMLDVITSLDPQFNLAYRFGAFFLSEHRPGGADRPDLAVRLLEKARAANPERWEYPHDIGFVYYRRGDYRQAAEWFRRAAAVPGATNWLEPLAAVTLATGGELESSRLLWRNLLATSDQPWIQRTAEFRLQQLDAVDDTRQLQQRAESFARRHGAWPADWAALVRDGGVPGVPLDPSGRPYLLDPANKRVTVQETSPMWPLPTEGAR